MRLLLLALAWIFVGIGVVGIVVPVLPTFDFMLLAAACFAKSSPRLENWLVNESRFGPAIRDWRVNHSVNRRNKVWAIGAIVTCLGVTVVLAPIHDWAKIGLAVLGVALVGYLATRREPYIESGSEGAGLGA